MEEYFGILFVFLVDDEEEWGMWRRNVCGCIFIFIFFLNEITSKESEIEFLEFWHQNERQGRSLSNYHPLTASRLHCRHTSSAIYFYSQHLRLWLNH